MGDMAIYICNCPDLFLLFCIEGAGHKTSLVQLMVSVTGGGSPMGSAAYVCTLSSTLALLMILQPWSFRSLNHVEIRVGLSLYYMWNQ